MITRISIIMGIYNCAPTLPEAIDSLLNQTYDGWKLIMCDDGSCDNTYEVANEYYKQYPEKMILIRNEKNMGLNYTLNRCLQYADTQYIARMDGDDISLPNRIENEVEFLDAHPQYAFVSCPMVYFDDNGDFKTGKNHSNPSAKDVAFGKAFCHAACMVRKEAYENVGGYSTQKNRIRVEDWDLWIKMYAKGYIGFNLSIPLYKMRDDRRAYSRRKYKYRINEFLVCISGITKLKLPAVYYIYSMRPLIVGLLPEFIYRKLHAMN